MGWADDGWRVVLGRWIEAAKASRHAYGIPILKPPVPEDELHQLELRIGSRLPPSYRSFLLTTDGLQATVHPPDRPPIDPFLPASRVHTQRRPGYEDGPVWLDSRGGLEGLFDVEGNVAERLLEADDYLGPMGHLFYAIKIDGGYPESYMYLDPLDVDADGEWRAWDGFKETCIKRRSFADVIEASIATLEQPPQPEFYKHVVDPSPEAAERLSLEARLLEGGEAADRAVDRLVELVTSDVSGQQRAPGMWVLLKSQAPVAQEAVLRLVESRPDDGVVVGNALQNGIAREHNPRVRAALFRALMGPIGESYASDIRWQWPELIDEVWHISRDPKWITHMLDAGVPGSLEAAIEALADPDLPRQVRFMLCYRLGYGFSEHPTPEQVAAIKRLVDIPGNSRHDLARSLLAFGETDAALSILDTGLEDSASTGNYLFMKLSELALPSLVPLLVASLHRRPTAQVLHLLGCIDHPDSAPELARHADGPLHVDAVISLEQLGTPTALDFLADRAAAGDLDAARALARNRDRRALQTLLRNIDGANRRSAVIGLRDLRDPTTLEVLMRIAAEDPDDNLAVLAAHGVVMTDRAHARSAAEALRRRADPHVRKLADHWLELLARPGDARTTA